ncbi:hypothetical protein CEXT_487671 [Caerostris extrusa]|uniref:Uncharacterized protein n=1 Tax=Caerostris extrusa TaxID=172846 RepID=A0AAV4Q999_CAEEX|nr:hypothetical protein CEXT_487671 [Caerostris extrusa]
MSFADISDAWHKSWDRKEDLKKEEERRRTESRFNKLVQRIVIIIRLLEIAITKRDCHWRLVLDFQGFVRYNPHNPQRNESLARFVLAPVGRLEYLLVTLDL